MVKSRILRTPLCSPKVFGESPNGLLSLPAAAGLRFACQFFLTLSQGFAEMARPKVTGRNMSPQHIKAHNSTRDPGTTDHPKARSENKKASSSKRIPIDPIVPSWARMYINAIHAFGAAHNLDNMAKTNTATTTEENANNEN
uniref:Uncharacterized protein n=1 Tax=Solanum tuberosum TaxID=4113 RepID=M1DNS1_SOLTU